VDSPRIVIDSNTLVSRLLLPSSTPSQAVSKAVKSGIILQSEGTLEELANVLSRKKFDRYVSIEDRQKFLRLLARISEFVEIVRRIKVCRDPKDDKFLELVANGSADYLLTGDKDLLELNSFENVPILTSKEFLDLSL
jgi:putative PIN family toxin of toxin-antitoxin system